MQPASGAPNGSYYPDRVRVLAFGTYDVRSHPRVGVLIEGLRDHGHEVVELNRSLGLSTAQRIAMVQQPWRLGLLVVRLLRCWLVLFGLGLRMRRSFSPDVILVGYLGHFDVHLARLLFRGHPIVLDHLVSAAGTTRDRGLAHARGPKARLMRWIDAAALGAADMVLVDTDERRQQLKGSVRASVVVCPVGAKQEWFNAGTEAVGRDLASVLRVVFVGLYTPLHGAGVLAKALALLADDTLVAATMVGDGQDRAAAQRIAAGNPRVTWLDWVPSDRLPTLVADHDVTLGIFGTTAKAAEVVPTKVYQGAAAANVVITSDTAPQRSALADAAIFVPAGDPGAIAAAVSRLARDHPLTQRLRRSARDRAMVHFTAAASVTPMLEALTLSGNQVSTDYPDR